MIRKIALGLVFALGLSGPAMAAAFTEPTSDANGIALGSNDSTGTNALQGCDVTISDSSNHTSVLHFGASSINGGGRHVFALPSGLVGTITGSVTCSNAVGTSVAVQATPVQGPAIAAPGPATAFDLQSTQ